MPLDRMVRRSGFGGAGWAEHYGFFPDSVEDVASAFDQARRSGVQVVLRGSGRSYGDAAIGPECVLLDLTGFNRILEWDPASGLIEAEPGVTIGDLWRRCLPDGWWPPVVSGTMFPTLGGALAMNIHGKNAFKVGTLGEHVTELEVLFPNGTSKILTPPDDLFYAVISGAGLLGVIVRVKLQMKRVHSGLLDVYAESCSGWSDQFRVFEERRDASDYMVSWIDAFGEGRGLFHSANHVLEPDSRSLSPAAQDLPSRIFGLVPKSQVWRFLRLLNNRMSMKALNLAKHAAGRSVGNRKTHRQSLVAFSFLLDYVPEWQRAYQPGGFIQYQSFVPAEHAKEVFAEQMLLQKAEKLENYLSVLKRHRPDRFLFSHAVEGYSLAMDFKVTGASWKRVESICHRMNDLVLKAGGRFYFAKDSTLRPGDVRASLGDRTLEAFRTYKQELDPDGLLTSGLARRLELA